LSPRPKSAKRERTPAPAPTTMSGEYPRENASFYTENDFVGPPTPPQQTTSKIRPMGSLRTVAQKLGAPLASIFTAPKSDIEEVQQEAGRHGLYTGTVYKPRKIQEEESQRWVVLGRDPGAVDQLVECKRKDVARQLELESQTTTSEPVVGAVATASPINVTCGGPSWWRIIAAGLVGAGVMFYMIVYCP